MAKLEKTGIKIMSANKKARHDYFVEETIEAGIELFGTEVKSIRAGTVNLKDSFVSVRGGEARIIGMHVSPYEKGNIFNKDPLRQRRLLLHKKEIARLYGLVKQDGYSIIPLSVYLKGSLVKVEIGLCRGKKNYDKRADMAKRDAQRKIEAAMKQRG